MNLLNPYISFPAAGVSYDADALAYFTACEAQGYTFPGGWKAAFDTFFLGLKADSLYTSIIEMGHFAHANAAANKVKMKTPANAFVTFTGSPTHGSNGVAFNGTSQYAAPGIAPNASGSQNSFGMGGYIQAQSGTGTAVYMGSENGTSDTFLMRSSGTQTRWTINRVSAYVTTANTNTQFNFITRTGSTAQALYRNGSSVATNNGTSNGNNSSAVGIGALLSFGAPASYVNATISFWIMTLGLNATQAGNLSSRISTLLTNTAGA